ncbi:homeobox protein 10-like [Chenopodium quinoa]|uniref:homeobox protein 10-like n=1 Tax=Chenopodium quinoa TaxID=63459 RepID=UPI000B772260|nr:homeobox protein 10-like [Chenopodium quinoa]
MTTKTHNYECCMCGDHGLSYELFRCKVCHFRSQHRYCSNLYPKAESYRVCNWCLIQKNNNDHQQDTLTPTTTTTTSNSPSSQDHHHQLAKTPNKRFINNHVGGPRTGIGAKSLQPTSPIKKPAGAETRSPSGRKRIVNGREGTGQNDEKIRRTKSEEISNNNNNSSSSSRNSGGNGGGGGGGGGPAVIKHVFRNKVRRYKLLEEVSS